MKPDRYTLVSHSPPLITIVTVLAISLSHQHGTQLPSSQRNKKTTAQTNKLRLETLGASQIFQSKHI